MKNLFQGGKTGAAAEMNREKEKISQEITVDI